MLRIGGDCEVFHVVALEVFDKLPVRMSNSRSEDCPGVSNQGTWRLIQLDFQGHLMGTDEKIERLQRQIKLLVLGMNHRSSTR